MTREEQLEFCKKCTNRAFSIDTGIICKLTKEPANFENSCPNFNVDNSAIPLDDKENIQVGNAHARLSKDEIFKLKNDQNLPMGILAAFIAGLIGAAIWGFITVKTGYQIGYMAIGIGALVGLSMRYFGKGIDQIFGISGGIIAFLSVAIGNFLSIIGLFAKDAGVPFFEILNSFDYAYLPEIMKESFQFMDIVFYGIAIYEGYNFSFLNLEPETDDEE
ncbi:MAG: inorganic phosphate transporter [Flavobacteriales bacterium]|jgi:hypothetical protein|nr:inorganic phosphate transporter [Flavobacteriales bacterium]